MKKILVFALLVIFITPSIALASWWNPFSWKVFKKKQVDNKSQVVTSEKTPEEKMIDLQKQLDELRNQQSSSNQEEKSIIKNTDVKVNTKKTAEESDRIKKEAELKAKFAEQDAIVNRQREEEKARIAAIDAKNALGKNYYNDLKYRTNTLIAMEKSYKSWLQDTSSQFRSASLTLAGYNCGGLCGQSRDSAIKLANANVTVISSLLNSTDKNISIYENVLEALKSDSGQFVSGDTFSKILTVEALESDISNAKKTINESLDGVLESLQWH